jgi:hypothetical protein
MVVSLGGAITTTAQAQVTLSGTEATQGVKAALTRGTEMAIAQLGKKDGFLSNPKVRIELPRPLGDIAGVLKTLGQGKRVDELVTTMNRAAELAVPQAKSLMLGAVRSMTVQDAIGIVRGGETSVTDFFANKTRVALTQSLRPLVNKQMEKLSLTAKYDQVAGKAAQMGLLNTQQSNLTDHVTAKTLDGLYAVIGEEERRIRQDPLGTGSAILKKVFGL